MPNNENQEFKEGAISFDDLQEGFIFETPTDEIIEEETPKNGEFQFEEEPKETEDNTEEKKTEEKPDVEEVKPETLEVAEKNPYFEITKKLIDSGKWDDAIVDGKDIKLSEYADITEEEYFDLLEQQKKGSEEELEEKYLKAEGVDEDKKRIASIVLNGGDLKEIFQSPQAMVKPFSEELGWNLDDEQHQASIVYQHFLSQGMTEKQAQSLVKAAQEDLNLDVQAQQIVDFHQKNYSEKLKKIEQDLVAEKEAEKERIKTYRSDLLKQYREDKLPDTLTKRLVDLATKESENGSLLIDEIYDKVMKDPKEAKEVILFLADKDKYLESKMAEVKNKTQVETFKTIKLTPTDRSKKAGQEKEETVEIDFILPPTM